MCKEVRLNDKLWFGKYKGKSIRVILDSDRNFLDNLVNKGTIKYGSNIIDYINISKNKYDEWKEPSVFHLNDDTVQNFRHDDWNDYYSENSSNTSI